MPMQPMRSMHTGMPHTTTPTSKDLTMMMNHTLAQLRELKLQGMAAAIEEQLSTPQSTALSECDQPIRWSDDRVW
jgi:hypothetical protein